MYYNWYKSNELTVSNHTLVHVEHNTKTITVPESTNVRISTERQAADHNGLNFNYAYVRGKAKKLVAQL